MLQGAGIATCRLPHPVPPVHAPTPARTEPLHLVFAGRLEPEKGLHEFLQALPEDFDARLNVIGAGSELKPCQELSSRRGWTDRVAFLGRLSHEETLRQ